MPGGVGCGEVRFGMEITKCGELWEVGNGKQGETTMRQSTIYTKVFDVQITGIGALLQHKFSIADEPAKVIRITGVRDFSDEAQKAMYVNDEGLICQPSEHIHKAMVLVSSAFKIPGRRGKTYKDSVNAALFLDPELIVHNNQTVTIDQRPVKVGQARIVRERPRIDDWSLDFRITVMDEQLHEDVVFDILELAGRMKGIGDYRPKFGRFKITRFDELTTEEILAAD